MDYQTFLQELQLEGRVLAITRREDAQGASTIRRGCSLAALTRALDGEAVVFTADNMECSGASSGFGFSDDLPPIPGGFGHFLSCGRGKGYPSGERIKRTPELGEQMMFGLPQNVMEGFTSIEVSPYREGGQPDTVSCLVNCDQLSALIHLYCYESDAYDNVIAPMVSGCASVFRIPFGELARGVDARAVIGGVDVFSRPHFPADTLFFTMPGTTFARILSLLDESMLASPIWRGVQRRLASPIRAE